MVSSLILSMVSGWTNLSPEGWLHQCPGWLSNVETGEAVLIPCDQCFSDLVDKLLGMGSFSLRIERALGVITGRNQAKITALRDSSFKM